jgi:hypothetical protein
VLLELLNLLELSLDLFVANEYFFKGNLPAFAPNDPLLLPGDYYNNYY